MAITVDVDCGENCFELPQWRELLERDPDRHIFSTPEWNRLWWEEFPEGKDLAILTLKREGEVIALVPLYRKSEDGMKILRFIGGIDLTDYLGPICAAEDRWDVADTLVQWLTETDLEWDVFDAHNMPVPFGFAEFLTERADAKGLEFDLEQEETSAILVLPDSWEEYLNGLKSKERHELRRKLRRIGRDHPDFEIRRADEETLDKDFKVFVEMHRGAEGHKGHFMRPEVATFFDRVARSFSELGWLRLDFLEVGGRAVASTFSFEFENVFYLYNSAYEPEAARLSPGLVLVARLVEDAIDRGLDRFDFLRGPERYKYQLGAEAVPLNNVRIERKMAS
jgi:CelD/BcsL family acetyltransferase involved in cellulose biosynthesis